jgi:4-aminobutyrate aminotransferase
MTRRPKIRVSVPGPNAKELVERDSTVLATSTKTSPVVAKRGAGVYIEDADGNLLIDFTSGIGVLNTGHCHPRIVNAIRRQVGDLMHFAGTDFYYEQQVALAEKLVDITPGDFPKKVFFTNSGAESVEAALKAVHWSTKRPKVLGFIGAFHGRTMGALGITASKPVHRGRFFYHMAGVEHVPYANCYRCPYKMSYPDCDVWCARIIEELYFETFVPPQDVGALFLEPVQGEGGYVVPPKKFMTILRKICDKYNIFMVDDEVQAGFGRTGKWFGIEHFGVVPEVVTIAKGMGSGLPIGAAVFDARLDWGVQGAHSNTYGGNPVACVSSMETIDVIKDERLLQNATKVGDMLRSRLEELQEMYPGLDNARGLGLMRAIEFVKDKESRNPDPKNRDKVIEKAYKNGLVLLPCGKSSIRFIPPLTINGEQMGAAMDVFSETIGEVLHKRDTTKAVKPEPEPEEEEVKLVLPAFKVTEPKKEPRKRGRPAGRKPTPAPRPKKKAKPKKKPKKKAKPKKKPKKKAKPKKKPKKKAKPKKKPKKKAKPKKKPKKKAAKKKAKPKKKKRRR